MMRQMQKVLWCSVRAAAVASRVCSSRCLSSKSALQFFRDLNIAKAVADVSLLQVLQSEIKYELSNRPYGEYDIEDTEQQNLLLGSFVVDSDLPHSQDIVLRKKHGPEDIAITAMLGPSLREVDEEENEGSEPQYRRVSMKVCITKERMPSVVQFDCRLEDLEESPIIERISFHDSTEKFGPSMYPGPPYSDLKPELQKCFVMFLESRGINAELAKFLIIHLNNKEQHQYVQWLQSVESLINRE